MPHLPEAADAEVAAEDAPARARGGAVAAAGAGLRGLWARLQGRAGRTGTLWESGMALEGSRK